jgi:hypothetical protein
MTVEITDNNDEVGAWLDELVQSYDFTRPGEDGSLGQDLARVVAQGVIDRTVAQQQAADGSQLRENEPRYRARKKKLYQVDQPGLRTGQMLSLTSVLGEVDVTADEVTLRYGIGEAPTSSSTGFISEADKRVTDRDKAGWFTEGGRPFYALDETINTEVAEHAGEALGTHLREHG